MYPRRPHGLWMPAAPARAVPRSPHGSQGTQRSCRRHLPRTEPCVSTARPPPARFAPGELSNKRIDPHCVRTSAGCRIRTPTTGESSKHCHASCHITQGITPEPRKWLRVPSARATADVGAEAGETDAASPAHGGSSRLTPPHGPSVRRDGEQQLLHRSAPTRTQPRFPQPATTFGCPQRCRALRYVP